MGRDATDATQETLVALFSLALFWAALAALTHAEARP
jgi:hypothetical protein